MFAVEPTHPQTDRAAMREALRWAYSQFHLIALSSNHREAFNLAKAGKAKIEVQALATTPSEPIAEAVAGEHPDWQTHEMIGGYVAIRLGFESGSADYWQMRAAIVQAITAALRTPTSSKVKE